MERNDAPFSICMEGWRFIPHSYAIISQFYSLDLLARPAIRLFHRDVPFYGAHWRVSRGLLGADREQKIAMIPAPSPTDRIDAIIRCAFPYDLTPNDDVATYVIATSEFRIVPGSFLKDGVTLATSLADSDVTMITCSDWSRQGFLASGADPDRLVVVPNGVDPTIFRPPDPDTRSSLRKQLRLDGCFAFLNVGAMRGNKGVIDLLTAFARVADRHPNARLVLKGLDSMYSSNDKLSKFMDKLPANMAKKIRPRLLYVGQILSLRQIAALYQVADAYVSPYHAEAFNIPVLEAVACGLPIICTAGGPTDEFVTPEFGRFIESELHPALVPLGPKGELMEGFHLVPDGDHLATLMCDLVGDADFVAAARGAGPTFVRDGWTWAHAVDKLLAVLEAPRA